MSDFFPDITTVRPRFSTAPTGEPVGGGFLRYNDERSKSYPHYKQKGRMYTMRRITMTGRLTRDPELKELTSKTDESKKLKRLTFGVANNDNGKDKDPEFFDAVAWDQLAVWGQQYLKKGSRILITGTPHNETYEKDGQKKFHFKIVADKIELIG